VIHSGRERVGGIMGIVGVGILVEKTCIRGMVIVAAAGIIMDPQSRKEKEVIIRVILMEIMGTVVQVRKGRVC
jgi:hypothetical protein